MSWLSTNETFRGFVPSSSGLSSERFEPIEVLVVFETSTRGFEMMFLFCLVGALVYGFAFDFERWLFALRFILLSFSDHF